MEGDQRKCLHTFRDSKSSKQLIVLILFFEVLNFNVTCGVHFLYPLIRTSSFVIVFIYLMKSAVCC